MTDGGEVRYAQVDDGGLYPDGSATVTVSETGTSGVLGTAALSSLDTVWLDPGSAWDAGPGSVVALVAQPARQQFFLGCEAFGGLSGLDFYSGCVDCVVAGLSTQDAWQSRARCSDERYGGEVRSFYRVDGLTLDGCAFATSGARPAGFDVQAVAGYGGGGLARTAAGAPLPLVRNLRVVNCEVSGPPRWLSTAQGGTYRQESGLHAVEFYEGTQALGPDGVPRGLYLGEGIVARGNLADGAPLALRYGYAASQDALEREYPSPAPEA